MAVLTPIDGWGFAERDFGDLAPPFDVEVQESTRHRFIIKIGWVGRVVSEEHRYSRGTVVMTPRNEPFNGAVVVRVFAEGDGDSDTPLYYGMALSEGLK